MSGSSHEQHGSFHEQPKGVCHGKAGVVQAKLGLVGASMNAMALIAPGAFLWITYQLQAAATAPSGASVASDMWLGIVLALIVCFLRKDLSGGGLCQLRLFRGEGMARRHGAEKERPEVGCPHIEARHGLVGPSLLLGLFGRHGCHDGHDDRLHLQPVHRP
ncbi:MAG: hypothetical protein ABSD38_04085 [Syntrophorhabdales bacterium]